VKAFERSLAGFPSGRTQIPAPEDLSDNNVKATSREKGGWRNVPASRQRTQPAVVTRILGKFYSVIKDLTAKLLLSLKFK
jgi:hypothetical protein